MVKRKRWPRKQGNDGMARISVPEEFFEARIVPQVDPKDDPPSAPQDDPRADPPIPDPAVAVLSRHIERLELQLAEALTKAADRDQVAGQRDLANAQVDALRGVVEIERERTAAERARVEEWKAVADRFALQAEALTRAAETRRGWWPFWRSA